MSRLKRQGQLSSRPSVYVLDLTDIGRAFSRIFRFIFQPLKAFPTLLAQERFGKKHLKSDGHLITEDSVLPTTAPGGAPERNRCYQTPATLLVLPLAPASLARSAHLAPLTTLRPCWGLALFG